MKFLDEMFIMNVFPAYGPSKIGELFHITCGISCVPIGTYTNTSHVWVYVYFYTPNILACMSKYARLIG